MEGYTPVTVCVFEGKDAWQVWEALPTILTDALLSSSTHWEKDDEDDPDPQPEPAALVAERLLQAA